MYSISWLSLPCVTNYSLQIKKHWELRLLQQQTSEEKCILACRPHLQEHDEPSQQALHTENRLFLQTFHEFFCSPSLSAKLPAGYRDLDSFLFILPQSSANHNFQNVPSTSVSRTHNFQLSGTQKKRSKPLSVCSSKSGGRTCRAVQHGLVPLRVPTALIRTGCQDNVKNPLFFSPSCPCHQSLCPLPLSK